MKYFRFFYGIVLTFAFLLGSNITFATPNACGKNSLKVCDVTFTALPTLTTISVNDTEIAIYTIRNNTPVRIKLNYIRVQNNDSQPDSVVTIDPAMTNACGAFLAAGASCNIKLNFLSQSEGTLNRVLQIGIDTRQVELDAPALTPTVIRVTPPDFPPDIPDGIPAGFYFCAVLASNGNINVGFDTNFVTVNGDACVTPNNSINAFPPGTLNGAKQINNARAAQAKADSQTTYNGLAALPCTATDILPTIVADTTFTPGVHCMTVPGDLTFGPATKTITFDAQGNSEATFTMIIPGSLTATFTPTPFGGATNTFVLANGANPENIYWVIGTNISLTGAGTSNAFYGNLLSNSGTITLSGFSIAGEALALNGSVSISSRTTITPT